jgi:S-DNA-T family DNA segregation ATPase FtsK/SpoIIIE
MKRGEVYITIAGAIIGVLGLIGVFSLISFRPEDVPGVMYPSKGEVQNICGTWGANIAKQLLYLFGFASYIVIFFMCIGGFCLSGALKLGYPLQRVSGAIFLCLSVSGWLAMISIGESFSNWPLPSLGGVFGFFYHNMFTSKIGVLGEALSLALFTFLGLFLIFEDKLLVVIHYLFSSAIKPLQNINVNTTPLTSNKMEAQLATAGGAPIESEMKNEKLKTVKENFSKVALPVEESERVSVKVASQEAVEETVEVVEEELKPKKRLKAEEKQALKEEEAKEKEESLAREQEARKKQANMAAARAVQEAIKKKPVTIIDELANVDGEDVQAMKGDDKIYVLPPKNLLEQSKKVQKESQSVLEEKAYKLTETLSDFGISSEIVSIVQGPVVTLFEISIGKGIRVQKILALPDNIAMALEAVSVRIIAPMPGKSTIGIEIPNAIKEDVRLLSIIESEGFDRSKYTLPFVLGRDAAGNALISDITKMPHVLIAGATGSGKSVCLNSLIVSMMMFCRPDELKMVMIDPKMVEMKGYEGLPHLSMPVVVDMKKATAVFERLVEQMEKRYRLLSKVGVRNIASYNAMSKEDIVKKISKYEEITEEEIQLPMPYIVVIVDELADLMMSAPKAVEICITRLAQKSRAVGIHVVLATQRPSVDVVTGLIKSNLPTRLSFQTASKIDSRTILDQQGAEGLLGMGDMLFMPPGTSKLVRAQGVYISDDEINSIIEHCTKQMRPKYDEELVNAKPTNDDDEEGGSAPGDDDDLFDPAVKIVLETERGSASLLQRKLGIGYNRASRLIEMMEERGIIGPHKGSVARDLYMTLQEWEMIQAGKMPNSAELEN